MPLRDDVIIPLVIAKPEGGLIPVHPARGAMDMEKSDHRHGGRHGGGPIHQYVQDIIPELLQEARLPVPLDAAVGKRIIQHGVQLHIRHRTNRISKG
jgi:hypothetical protein